MSLTGEQIAYYREHGYLLLENVFSVEEAELIRGHAMADLGADTPRRVCEANSGLVRAVHGSHLAHPFFADLVRLPRLLRLVEQILDEPAYVHQFKINAKAARGGEQWEWHQDSYFWQREDGMLEPLAVNVAVHLDDVNELNGPLQLIPGSHRIGEVPANEVEPAEPGTVEGGAAAADIGDWRRTVSSKLKYALDGTVLAELVDRHGVVSVAGRIGTVLLFHPAVVHGSADNLSPFDRCLLIISYNRTSNRLGPVAAPRPDFLASRNFTPLEPLAADRLPDYAT